MNLRATSFLARLLTFVFFTLAPVALMYSATAVVAQDTQTQSGPDYAAWEKVAARAEEAVDAARASTVALEDLRNELVDWRDKFQKAQAVNQTAITTVQSQLEALGPKPETGEEAPEIANQRKALEERLAQLQAPVKAAQVAYSRADALIRGIDKIIRERQTDELLEFGPSPVNPAYWGKTLEVLQTFVGNLSGEATSALASPIQRSEMKKNIPALLIFSLIAFVLLLRGRRWMERFTLKIQEQKHTAGRWFFGLLLSIGQVVLPLIGIIALVQAFYATQLVGLRSDRILSLVPAMGLTFFVARWLGARVFPKNRAFLAPLSLDENQRRQGRFYSGVLGLMLALNMLFLSVAEYESWPPEVLNVLLFPPLVISALALFRLGQLLLQHLKAGDESGEHDGAGYRDTVIGILGRVLMAVAVIGPLAAAIGYFKAGEALVFPTVMSLALISFLLVLQRVVTGIYAIVIGDEAAAKESLVTVLIGFAMTLASTPLFALIWGARVADLTEIWTRFQEGFTIGGARISPGSFIAFAVIFSIGYMLTRLVQGMLKSSVLPKTKIDPGGQNAIVSGLGYIGIFLSAVIAISAAGIDLSSLAIVAGALSVGIGFGLQNIVSNFVSGIILLIERPIAEGDWIEVGGKMGYVRDISVRSTRIETFDRTDVIVPNSELVSGMVTNWTRGNSVGRIIVPVGVAYGTDTKRVEHILREIAQAHPMVLANPAPGIVFQGFGADSLDFEIRAILRDVNWSLSVKSDINHEIARRFAEEKIEIPFAQRDLWFRNPESLRAAFDTKSTEETDKAKDGPSEEPAADSAGDRLETSDPEPHEPGEEEALKSSVSGPE